MVTKTTSLFFCAVQYVSQRASTVPKNCEFVRFVQVRTLIKTDLRTGTKAKFLKKDEAPNRMISVS